jgi:hypothetical protein
MKNLKDLFAKTEQERMEASEQLMNAERDVVYFAGLFDGALALIESLLEEPEERLDAMYLAGLAEKLANDPERPPGLQ